MTAVASLLCAPCEPAPALLELGSPEQIEALLEPIHQALLEALLRRPSSVGELAASLGQPLRTVHYRVARLERLGFVRVQGIRARRGRPIKVYAPTAQDGWRFPFSRSNALSFSDLAMLYMQQHGRTFWQEAEGRVQDELWISFERYGTDTAGFNVQSGDPAQDYAQFAGMVSGWFRLHLSDAEAQELSGQLHHLLERYAFRPQGTGHREYLLGTFFVDRSGF